MSTTYICIYAYRILFNMSTKPAKRCRRLSPDEQIAAA
jgi:hypothetical protein